MNARKHKQPAPALTRQKAPKTATNPKSKSGGGGENAANASDFKPMAEMVKKMVVEALSETGVGKAAAASQTALKKPAHAYERTKEGALAVQLCKAGGFTDEQTAQALDISVSTLRRHYPDELASGGRAVMLAVIGNLVKIATKGEDKAAVTAAIFMLKCREGWNDKPATINVDATGNTAPVEFTFNFGSPVPGIKSD
jgi:hypothetical protein